MKASGSFVAPDKMQMSMNLYGQDLGFVIIGKQAWVKAGGPWQEASAGELDLSASPQDFFGDFLPEDVLKVASTSREKVNGIDAIRYSFNKKDLEQVVATLGGDTTGFDEVDDASLDLWLNADNIPVKMAMAFAAQSEDGRTMLFRMDMNVTHINDASIKIKPPS